VTALHRRKMESALRSVDCNYRKDEAEEKKKGEKKKRQNVWLK
jgi:hypothetical protein